MSSFNKNPKIAVGKSQLCSKVNEDSDSDVEFIDMKMNTESKPRSSYSSSRDMRRRSPPRRHHHSRSPYQRRSHSRTSVIVRSKSRSRSHDKEYNSSNVEIIDVVPKMESIRRDKSRRSPPRRTRRSKSPNWRRSRPKTPVNARPRSRSRSRGRSHSRSQYSKNYSSHRNGYSSESRERIFPLSNGLPLNSVAGYVPGHPRMFNAPYMPFPRQFMRFLPPGCPSFYSPDLYSATYQPHKEMSTSSRRKKLKYPDSYSKNPEKHPMYQNEWEMFWSKCLKEIYDNEINENSEKLKKKLLEKINLGKSFSESSTRRKDSPQKDKKSMVDSKISSHANLGSEVVVSESDSVNKPSNDKNPKVTGASPNNSDSESSINELNDQNKTKDKIQIENPLNTISVLRQLSVLENQLGLFAPEIMNLLSEGLVMEKLEPKSSINLLTSENCLLLEMVKEKLTGQFLAGVVKKRLVNATLFSICNIDKLMQLAPKFVPTVNMLNATITPTPTPIVPTPIVPEVGIMDKLFIVTFDQLVTLINHVVGMAKNNTEGVKNVCNSEDVLRNTDDENDMDQGDTKLEELSQEDIIILLKNFTDLKNYEQAGLIIYLKKLCGNNLNDMNKFINMGPPELQEITSMLKEADDDVDN